MPRDHYISQTYLRKFEDPNSPGHLNAYRKSDGSQFICRPKDVCREWNGDLNPGWFEERPGMLGDIRKVFEPSWNPAVGSLEEKTLSGDDRFMISGLMATFMTCTPSWQALTSKFIEFQMKSLTEFDWKMHKKHGLDFGLSDEAMEALLDGKIGIEAKEGFSKAMATKQILDLAWRLFHSDWSIMYNTTDQEFITSDNPVAIADRGEFGISRFLPITPRMALWVDVKRTEIPQFSASVEALGDTRFGPLQKSGVKLVNRMIAQCSEELVFSSTKSDGISILVEKWRDHHLGVEFGEHPGEVGKDEIYQISSIGVIRRQQD